MGVLDALSCIRVDVTLTGTFELESGRENDWLSPLTASNTSKASVFIKSFRNMVYMK